MDLFPNYHYSESILGWFYNQIGWIYVCKYTFFGHKTQ